MASQLNSVFATPIFFSLQNQNNDIIENWTNFFVGFVCIVRRHRSRPALSCLANRIHAESQFNAVAAFDHNYYFIIICGIAVNTILMTKNMHI